jgi:exodeoxyribonuclease VII small subunit
MNNNEDKQEDRTNPGFEHTFKRLEVVSQKLEAGGLTLDEAMDLYEEGMNLARECSERLNATELRISELQTSFSEYTSSLASAEPETPAENM